MNIFHIYIFFFFLFNIHTVCLVFILRRLDVSPYGNVLMLSFDLYYIIVLRSSE